MSLHNLPNVFSPTDSNVATSDLLIESLFKKALPVTQYQNIDARTVNYNEASIESSTTESVSANLLSAQANSIFINAKEEVFEDGMESNFSRNLSKFIVSFGHSAMETIIPIVLSERANTEVVSEAFRVLGRLVHATTYRERLWLLERGLYSASARVRDGSLLGLEILNDSLAIPPLKAAINRERIPELRQDMEQVVSQLEGNKDDVSAKKNS